MQGFHPVFLLRYVGNNPIDEAQCIGLVIDGAGVQGCPKGAAVFTEKFPPQNQKRGVGAG